MEKIKIKDLVLDKSIWPRKELDGEVVERYEDCINELPSIVVEKKSKKVIDGWHRIEAFKRQEKEEIPYVLESCDDHLLLAKAYNLNSKHGLPVHNSTRDEIIGKLHKQGLIQQQIARQMGLSQMTISRILSDLNIGLKWDSKQGLRDYFSGMSLREVAKKHEVGKTTVERALREYNERKDLISRHLKSRGHLKSIVEYEERGPWGDNKFRGNCSGYLLVDLIDYFEPKSVLDPMEGSGTTGDVCFDMGDIHYKGLDLVTGFDLVQDNIGEEFDFIFWHPAYWSAIDYDIDHPNNLSRCKTYKEFLEKLKICMNRLVGSLNPGGHLAILYGDGRHQGKYYSTHSDIISFDLIPLDVVLIKLRERTRERSHLFNYGAGKFVPTVHEYVLIFER